MNINLDDTIKGFDKSYEANPNAVKKGEALFRDGKVEYQPQGFSTKFQKSLDF